MIRVGRFVLLSVLLQQTLFVQSFCQIRHTTTASGRTNRVFSIKSKKAADQESSFDLLSYCTLSVVIPAYNEQDRLESTVLDYCRYLSETLPASYNTSIVIVDDGSIDGTLQVISRLQQIGQDCAYYIPISCVPLTVNQGKGAALAAGIEYACQTNFCCNSPDQLHLILTTDADGSAAPTGIQAMLDAMASLLQSARDLQNMDANTAVAMVAGYRTYDAETNGTSTSPALPLRRLFRWGFRTTVRAICGDTMPNGVADTQCGFKLMTAAAGMQLYQQLHLKGWSHDVEVLYRAKQLNIPVVEQPILWQDKPGSKLVASGVWNVILRMFWDVMQLRVNYATGKWR